MRQSSNLGLALYDKTDLMNITGLENSLNHNMELIDSEISQLSQNKAATPKSVSVTLAAASWDSIALTQTVTVSGVSATETTQIITPTPALASQAAYYEAGILCTAQTENSLTFTCTTAPTEDLTVYVVIQEVGA